MRKLYHLWLCPFSRKVRICLKEKKLDFELYLELPWKRSPELLALNPLAQVPVLVDEQNIVICDSGVIVEYLDEAYDTGSLFSRDIYYRAEVRRISAWFDNNFYQEVTKKIVFERTMKRHLGLGAPDVKVIRQGMSNLKHHIDYMNHLLSKRKWLAGDTFSMADIVAGANISAIDYLGSINWSEHEVLKEWYVRFKSRPSMRNILQEKISTFVPPDYYSNLDF